MKQTLHRGATVDHFKNGYVGVMIGATATAADEGDESDAPQGKGADDERDDKNDEKSNDRN